MLKALSVKQFNEYIKTSIKHDPILSRVYIKGSVYNIRNNGNHLYFSLKEDEDIIDCVIYYYETSDISLDFNNGMDVVVKGNLLLNNYSSRLTIAVNSVDKDGLSEQYLKFLKMKEEFNNKGYFDENNKKEIKDFPNKIGLITSIDGAAIVDFISVINQKPNDIKIKLVAVKVQGQKAVSKICKSIEYLDQLSLDAIVITRGGGSDIDLSVFNSREIIESAFKAKTPIISAIGHKIDTTLIDLVADKSLQTPTEAGSFISRNYLDIEVEYKKYLRQIQAVVQRKINLYTLKLNVLSKDLSYKNPYRKILELENSIKILKTYIDKDIQDRFKDEKLKLKLIKARLEASKNLIELRKKQISIKNKNGEEIYSRFSVKDREVIEITFSDGSIKAVIDNG